MQVILALLAALLYTQVPSQDRLTPPLSTEVVAKAVEAKEAGWEFAPAFCTCESLFKTQISHSVGLWERTTQEGERETIQMDIYQVESAKEASEWMRQRYERMESGAICRDEAVPLGDVAYQTSCPDDPRNKIRVTTLITLRRGNYIVQVRGGNQETVERFARYALGELPAS